MAIRSAACGVPVLRVKGDGCSMTVHRAMFCSNQTVKMHRWFNWFTDTHQYPPANSKPCSHTPSFSDIDLVAEGLSERNCSPDCEENSGEPPLTVTESPRSS
jgi:hypothetical protein